MYCSGGRPANVGVDAETLSLSVTDHKRGAQRATIRLTKAGKKYTIAGHKTHLTKTIKVKISKPKHKKKKAGT
jgi:hypothetical protein